jgi:hypothetical protein
MKFLKKIDLKQDRLGPVSRTAHRSEICPTGFELVEKS